jgi:hypothetical protein
MPRYEIVAHVVCDLDCETPDEAAAVFKRRLLPGAEPSATLRHLAAWSLAADLSDSAMPASLRRHLADFFADLERSAAEAEEVFRVRVEAILAAPDTAADPHAVRVARLEQD